MHYSAENYCKGLLILLSMLGSGTTLANKSVNDAAYPVATHSGFFSALPALLNPKNGHAVIQFGGFWTSQGKAQHVNIEGLIGDDFTVNSQHSSNALVGLGYFIDKPGNARFTMAYGLNFFYLPKTGVAGTVVQESLFTNLSYGYNLTHYPLYAIAKSTIDLNSTHYALTIDLGIGPNFMNMSSFHEASLDGGMTLPDQIFSGHTTTTFSATAGLGVKFNQVFGDAPLECGYRFFYLGQGNFNILTNQVTTKLSTGTAYANALLCSITI